MKYHTYVQSLPEADFQDFMALPIQDLVNSSVSRKYNATSNFVNTNLCTISSNTCTYTTINVTRFNWEIEGSIYWIKQLTFKECLV